MCQRLTQRIIIIFQSTNLIIEKAIPLIFGQRSNARLTDNDRRNDSNCQIVSGLTDGRCCDRRLWKIFGIMNENFCTVKRFAVRHVRFLLNFNAQMQSNIFTGTRHPVNWIAQLFVDGIFEFATRKNRQKNDFTLILRISIDTNYISKSPFSAL